MQSSTIHMWVVCMHTHAVMLHQQRNFATPFLIAQRILVCLIEYLSAVQNVGQPVRICSCTREFCFALDKYCMLGLFTPITHALRRAPFGCSRLPDMEESWRLLGLASKTHGCTTCLIRKDSMAALDHVAPRRTFAEAKDAVAIARATLAFGHGYKGKAEAGLAKHGLLSIHMRLRNPFFELPHVDFECFPMDRLHGVYVGVCLRACACACVDSCICCLTLFDVVCFGVVLLLLL